MSNSDGISTAKECSRKNLLKIESVSQLQGEPKGDECHVYYIHRDGTTYCSPDQKFDPKAENNAPDIGGSLLGVNETQDIPTNEIDIGTSSRNETEEIEQCADDRLILV
jgi:hypothetical protein